jgi:hypothetical protein
MRKNVRRLGVWSAIAAAFTMVGGGVAFAQHGGGGGGGTVVFTSRRPPRDFTGNMRGWASGAHVSSYNEDVQSHMWRVNFMAFLPRSPNAAELTLAWFHIEPNGVRRYISNEPIALSSPTDRVLVYNTSLHRAAGEFEPMEHYEAVLSVNDSHGAHPLAHGQIQLIGQVERHSGVVDFTGGTPTAH